MVSLQIGDFKIAEDAPPFIIAEIGNNHDGDLVQAFRMIAAAAACGADAVKFQTYSADQLVRPEHELHGFFSRFALPSEWHGLLMDRAKAEGVIFLSTPFDAGAADFLVSLGVPALKVASSDLTNTHLLRHCAGKGLPLLLSTGMAGLDEVEQAVRAAEEAGCRQLAVLHCVSIYPTPPEKTNLSAVAELRKRFKCIIGFSDHSLSPAIPAAAVALGARIIEKHFTVSRSLKGPDHAVALEPDEFALMAESCREVATALGDGSKRITPELEEVRRASLRGLYAAVGIKKGQRLRREMVSLLRPAGPLTASDLPSLLDQPALADIEPGAPLQPEMFGKKE
jgi:N,N'-diacetyllegionaminate synthase